MCFKKTTIFACRCFLRDTSACPHSACLAEGELEKSKERLAAEMFARPSFVLSSSSLLSSSLPAPGIAPPPGFSPPPLFSPDSASSSSSSFSPGPATTTNTNTGNNINGNNGNNNINNTNTTNAAEAEFEAEHERAPSPASPAPSPASPAPAPAQLPPRIIDGLFYERRMGQVQRAIHWDQWRTEWFPCAAYHSTHLDTVVNSEEEYMNCLEYFGDEDKEVKVLGLCEECRGVHGDALKGVGAFGTWGQGGGNGRGEGQGRGQGDGHAGGQGQKRQEEGEPEMREVREALNRWMDME